MGPGEKAKGRAGYQGREAAWPASSRRSGATREDTPTRLVVLEGNVLEVFFIDNLETLRCSARDPQFLYVTATERPIKETK
jgi:adenylylsulfate kinase-like enzyme